MPVRSARQRRLLFVLWPILLQGLAAGCTEPRQRCSDTGSCENGQTCTLSSADGVCVDLRSERKFPGPCTSRYYRSWGEEGLLVDYVYNESSQLLSCDRTYYDEETGDGGGDHIAFQYDSDGALASLVTQFFSPFDSHDATWTFDSTGTTSRAIDDVDEFVTSYEPNPQFEYSWPQFCTGELAAPGSRLERIVSPDSSTSETFRYSYDGPPAPGTRTQTEVRSFGPDGVSTTSTTLLTYDDETRLIRLEREDGSGYEQTYDANGRWTAHTELGDDGYRQQQLMFYDQGGNIRAAVSRRVLGQGPIHHTFYTYDCW